MRQHFSPFTFIAISFNCPFGDHNNRKKDRSMLVLLLSSRVPSEKTKTKSECRPTFLSISVFLAPLCLVEEEEPVIAICSFDVPLAEHFFSYVFVDDLS